jgi:hypothetical protein
LGKELTIEDIKSKIELIHDTFDELLEIKNISKDELSSIDRELSNHYHNIEGSEIKFMTDSHLMIMKLKDILFFRRDAKIKYMLLESFIGAMERSMTKTKKRYSEIVDKHQKIKREIINRATD